MWIVTCWLRIDRYLLAKVFAVICVSLIKFNFLFIFHKCWAFIEFCELNILKHSENLWFLDAVFTLEFNITPGFENAADDKTV